VAHTRPSLGPAEITVGTAKITAAFLKKSHIYDTKQQIMAYFILNKLLHIISMLWLLDMH